MPRLEITLFGTPQIHYQAVPIEFVRRKAVALVAYLAVTNQPQSRDLLAEFLWPDNDAVRSRAGLRRILSSINQTPLDRWINADRETIALKRDPDLSVDVERFQQLIAQPVIPESLVEAILLYRDNFMAGFTLRDSAAFDHWQSTQTQRLQQKFFVTLQRLSDYYFQQNQLDEAAAILQRWLHFDPLHEPAQFQLISLYASTGQRGAAIEQYARYAALLENELGIPPQAETRQLYERIRDQQSTSRPSEAIRGSLPPLPALFVGREQASAEVKRRLNVGVAEDQSTSKPLVVLQGWPGIGKTTLSSVLAHDGQLQAHYRDGTLWVSLGQDPNLMAILSGWGRSLGFHELERAQTVEEASARLTAFLTDKRILIIIDDVWAVEDAQPLKVGGEYSGLLITTRLNDVARHLADRPESIYKIPILSLDESLTLLGKLAPKVVAQYPAESATLASDLEGLPLALQVAGRMLHAEMELGWGITDLLRDLREGQLLLDARVPADRAGIAAETTPTIAALLQRSVTRLSAEIQEKFALLAVFAPKPASFTLEAIQSVWHVQDARPATRILIDRGLLEPDGSGRFQMHALLVMLARSMFQD